MEERSLEGIHLIERSRIDLKGTATKALSPKVNAKNVGFPSCEPLFIEFRERVAKEFKELQGSQVNKKIIRDTSIGETIVHKTQDREIVQPIKEMSRETPKLFVAIKNQALKFGCLRNEFRRSNSFRRSDFLLEEFSWNTFENSVIAFKGCTILELQEVRCVIKKFNWECLTLFMLILKILSLVSPLKANLSIVAMLQSFKYMAWRFLYPPNSFSKIVSGRFVIPGLPFMKMISTVLGRNLRASMCDRQSCLVQRDHSSRSGGVMVGHLGDARKV